MSSASYGPPYHVSAACARLSFRLLVSYFEKLAIAGSTAAILGRTAPLAPEELRIRHSGFRNFHILHYNAVLPAVAHVIEIRKFSDTAREKGRECRARGVPIPIIPIRLIRHARRVSKSLRSTEHSVFCSIMIEARKKAGLGGSIPLGYKVVDKKVLVVPRRGRNRTFDLQTLPGAGINRHPGG